MLKLSLRTSVKLMENDDRSVLLPPSGRSSPSEVTPEPVRKKAREERRVEEQLKKAGFGLYHVILVLVTGLATAADSVEIFGVSFVLPIADRDLDLSTAHKGYLDASIFIGRCGYIMVYFAIGVVQVSLLQSISFRSCAMGNVCFVQAMLYNIMLMARTKHTLPMDILVEI